MSGGELVVRALRSAGASALFTLNGSHIWPALDAAARLGMRVVDTRDERTAAFAAEATSRLTRSCGFAAVTAGPGVTNSISALAGALANDTPMFLLGGRAATLRWGLGQLQEMEHLELARPVTKRALTAGTVESVHQMATGLVNEAMSQRTGPVFMDVPADVIFAQSDAPLGETPARDVGPEPDPDAVRAVADLIRAAQRPVLVVGGMAWWAGCEQEVQLVAERAGLPTYLVGQARGMLAPGHRLFRSRSRSAALKEADLVVLVGAGLDFRLGFGEPPLFPAQASLAYVDVDGFRKHKEAKAAVYGDLRRALAGLAEEVRDQAPRSSWLERLAEAEAAARERDRPLLEAGTSPVHPARLVAEVAAFCDPDAIVIGDGGDFVSFAGRIIERPRPGLWLDPGPFGCLGTGAGYAIAARVAHPDRQVVLLAGDGAFGFFGMEFDTLVRHRLPVVCVVGNNGLWGLEEHPMKRLFGETVATRLQTGARYDLMVEALGGHGELVERPQEIRPALERALRSGLPALVNVLCDPAAEYPRSSVLM